MNRRPPNLQLTSGNRSVLASLSARVVTLAVGLASVLFGASVLIESLGPGPYGAIMTIAALVLLLPFADLGIGAAVTNAAASGPDSKELRAVLVSSIRALFASAGVVLMAAVGLHLTGSWASLVGTPFPNADLAASATLAIFAVTLPLTVGQRILLGSGQAHKSVLLQGIAAPLTALTFYALAQAEAPAAAFVLSPVAAVAVVNVITFVVAMRLVNQPLHTLVRNVLLRQGSVGAPIFATAAPALAIMVAIPLTLQSHRIVLVQRSTLAEIATYTMGYQLYAPALGLIATGGNALWPIFAARRVSGEASGPLLGRMVLLFGCLATLQGIVLLVAGPSVADFVSDGKLSLSWPILSAFAGLLAVQAVWYPLGMFLTYPAGLRAQAVLHALMLVVSLPISYWLAGLWGAEGPLVASGVAFAVCVLTPGAYIVQRQLRAQRSAGVLTTGPHLR